MREKGAAVLSKILCTKGSKHAKKKANNLPLGSFAVCVATVMSGQRRGWLKTGLAHFFTLHPITS